MKVVAIVFRFTVEGGVQLGRVFARDGKINDLLKKIGEKEHIRSASVLKRDPDDPEFYTTAGGRLLDGANEFEEVINEGKVILLTYASKLCYISPVE